MNVNDTKGRLEQRLTDEYIDATLRSVFKAGLDSIATLEDEVDHQQTYIKELEAQLVICEKRSKKFEYKYLNCRMDRLPRPPEVDDGSL